MFKNAWKKGEAAGSGSPHFEAFRTEPTGRESVAASSIFCNVDDLTVLQIPADLAGMALRLKFEPIAVAVLPQVDRVAPGHARR
jgi:hypothetical protein